MSPSGAEGSAPAGAPGAAEADLLPFLPELTGGLESLERLPEPYVELLSMAGLSAGARVLDLACGKGAAAIALAVRLGVEVDGVDAVEPFVRTAEAEARRRGLPCRFRPGSPDEAVQAASGNPRDALLCVGLGRPFGTLRDTVAALRTAVRPGGLILLEDGYLREGVSIALPEFATYRERGETIADLCAHGDLVVGERLAPKEEVCAQNARDLDGLRSRAEALAARRPELRAALNLWLGGQAMQARLLEASLQPAAWVLRRGGGSPS
jgi:SAM-dependent methyltransferase